MCNRKVIDNDATKIVCVCNSKLGCGELNPQWPRTKGEAYLYESSEAGKRFDVSNLNSGESRLPKKSDNMGEINIKVKLNMPQQSIMGWGGAFTDATGVNLKTLSPSMAENLLESYYGESGLQYNFGRVPIGGTDFSTRAYTYDDANKTDYKLSGWALATEDYHYKIPFIKRAMSLAKQTSSDGLKLFASPWSPPTWMKTNHDFARGSLIDEDKVYRSYAEYLMKFYDAYKANGINFWGATVQNEPLSSAFPFYTFNSLHYSNEQMIKFVSKYLGPALEGRGYTKENFNLMIGDDNLGLINNHVPEVMKDPEVQKYISGLAFHWYTSGIVPYDALTEVVDAVKDKISFVLMTEACEGSQPLQKKVDLGSWSRGEAYAKDIIQDLNRRAQGWIDWNMALDPQGGPTWAKNFVDSPIIVNATSNEFYKQPMYYALGHFSRFFKPSSVVVATEVADKKWTLSNDIYSAAIQNDQTGHVVVNILNTSTTKKKVNILLEGNSGESSQIKAFAIDEKSLNSLILKT